MKWMTTRILSVCVFTLILVSSAQAREDAWIDFKLENGHIKIPVTLDGHEVDAILDTGAGINGINENFIKKFKKDYDKGRKLILTGVFGKKKVNMLNNVPIDIFGFETELDSLAPYSMGHYTDAIILGAGFFQNFLVQIDYPNSKIRVLPRNIIDLKEVANLDMRAMRGSGEPLVKVNVNQKRDLWLLLDTGMSGGIFIERNVANSIDLLDEQGLSSVSTGVNTSAKTETFNIDSLKFGPFMLESVLATIPEEGISAFVTRQNSFQGTRIRSKKMQGILGYDVLKHFVLTIDYKGGHAHIAVPAQ